MVKNMQLILEKFWQTWGADYKWRLAAVDGMGHRGALLGNGKHSRYWGVA